LNKINQYGKEIYHSFRPFFYSGRPLSHLSLKGFNQRVFLAAVC